MGQDQTRYTKISPYRLAGTSARGYGVVHQRLRARWALIVASGAATCTADVCVMPSRRIAPGSAWHLGHDEQRIHRGPEHARCNLAAAARKMNKVLRQRRRVLRVY